MFMTTEEIVFSFHTFCVYCQGKEKQRRVESCPLSFVLLKCGAWTFVGKRTFLDMIEVPVLMVKKVVCSALSLAGMSIILSWGSAVYAQRLHFSIVFVLLNSIFILPEKEIFQKKTSSSNLCKERMARDLTETLFFNIMEVLLNQNSLQCVPGFFRNMFFEWPL